MRNVLEHFKGKLQGIARDRSGINKRYSWNKVADVVFDKRRDEKEVFRKQGN